MPFVKLDTGILNSTLWIDRDSREMFITALLMAEPREFVEPLVQLSVREIKETGFVAPADWYGYVPAAGVGIIGRAKLEIEPGLAALEKLGSPDIWSRSSRFEGRRLIRINGGFVVLNYMEYRDRDYTAAERQKRYRERQRNKQLHRDVTPSPRNITQAEAEAYINPPTPLLEDLEQHVREIASLYPKISDAQNLSHEIELAIAEAVARHGRDAVWAGTKSMAEKVAKWPKSELRFVPGASRYFRESQYQKNPAEWERVNGNGNSKAVERDRKNAAAILDGFGFSEQAAAVRADVRPGDTAGGAEALEKNLRLGAGGKT